MSRSSSRSSRSRAAGRNSSDIVCIEQLSRNVKCHTNAIGMVSTTPARRVTEAGTSSWKSALHSLSHLYALSVVTRLTDLNHTYIAHARVLGLVRVWFMPRNLFFSTDIDAEVAKADIIFVSVNTPTKTGVSHTSTHTCLRCTAALRWHGGGAVNERLFHPLPPQRAEQDLREAEKHATGSGLTVLSCFE